MDHFQFIGGQLCAENVPLARIADAVGTPFYCYSTATIERHYNAFAEALAGLDAAICYAVKANGNIAVIRTLARLGAGADVVSGGELKRAIAGGISPHKIVFSGVGKTEAEMIAALQTGIMQINIESEPELEVLNRVACDLGMVARVSVRINPDVDARTHAKITTGKSENKFGVEWTRVRDVFARAAEMQGIDAIGIAVHIGSQLIDLEPFRNAYLRVRELVTLLRADGYRIERLDLGGGIGIPYGEEDDIAPPSLTDYADIVRDTVGDLDCPLVFEPGRMIVGNAGVLVTRVIYVKEGPTRSFAIVDAAMNDLIRPTLYNAHHAIVRVRQGSADSEDREKEYDVVGPICETGDLFGSGRKIPELTTGDLLAVRTAGAYGAVQASTYNARPLVAEVMVSGDAFAVIRPRIEINELIARETIPDWLTGPDGP